MVVLLLMVVGVASVLVAWLADVTVLAYVALGVSLVGLGIVAARAWQARRRRASLAGGEPEENGDEVESGVAEDPEDQLAASGAGVDEEVPDAGDATGANSDGVVTAAPVSKAPERRLVDDLAEDTIVHVIAGRKRFHLPACERLGDREYEELTLEEAREEGFSACTRCCHRTGVASVS